MTEITVNILTLNLSAIVLYTMAAISRIYQPPNLPISPKFMIWFLGLIAVSFHAIVLYQGMITPVGINLGIFNAASLISWVMATMLLLVLLRKPLEDLVIVLFPLAAVTIILGYFFYSERILPSEESLGVKIHITSSILAYSLLSITAFQALFLAIQDYQLRHKHPRWILRRLPPLRVMEVLLFQMISIGVVLLTLSLVTAFLFMENIFAPHLIHKTVLAILAWWIFAILLWGHWRYGWRGRTAIRWNLSGFFVLMLAYFGSKFVLELLLK